MEKKKYTTPSMDVITLKGKAKLLSGSQTFRFSEEEVEDVD